MRFGSALGRCPLVFSCALLVIAAPAAGQAGQGAQSDPFSLLDTQQGSAALVPPRALAVIPERHVGRLIRVVDTLSAIDPQFDDLATGAGLDGTRAIQIRTREARVPIFVKKDESTVAMLLQLPIGAQVQVTGILIARGGRYLFLASEVRPAPTRRSRTP